MKPIPISSCQHCNPETWIVEKAAKGTYRCKCGRIVHEVLKKKEKEDE